LCYAIGFIVIEASGRSNLRTLVKWVLGLFAALIVVFVGGGFLLPDEAVVQRQAVIKAPPEKVFAIISNIKRNNEWSPWAELDPNMKVAYEGPDAGVGQKLVWDSANSNVGKGSQTFTEIVENRRVASELDLGNMGKATASMELAPVPDGTGVTWGFKSHLDNLVERWFGLLFDRWIGADYEKGLAKLKALAEKQAGSS
jgi:uncharacterized protein YndB with AHSA1/START domain